jgi:CheY-like chemotaxis protein
MATALATTLNSPMSELRASTMELVLVIEHDAVLRKILRQLLSSEEYEVEVVPDVVVGLEILCQKSQRQ